MALIAVYSFTEMWENKEEEVLYAKLNTISDHYLIFHLI